MSQPIRLILVVCYKCVVIVIGVLGNLVNANVKVSKMLETLHWLRNFE